MIIFGVPSTLIVYGVVGIEQKGTSAPRPIATIGDWSYALYLSHVLTLSAIGYLWSIVAGHSGWDNWIVLPLMVIACVLVSGVFWYAIEKPLLHRFSRMRERFFT